MNRVTLTINLTLKGPILTQATNPGDQGLDLVVARHSDGIPYLSGTLVTGKLRQALEELQDINNSDTIPSKNYQPEIEKWLGQNSYNDLPKTKQLYFSDFDLLDQNKLRNNLIRDRIEVNDTTGCVEPHHIVMIENPFLSGEDYTFTGQLHFFSPKKETTYEIINHVKTGFHWLSQLGSLKSIGFGQVSTVTFEKPIIRKISTFDSETKDYNAIYFNIKPEYPFCITSKPVADNLFESEVIIPGGNIMGSIATTWNHLLGKQSGTIEPGDDPDRKELCENFSNIRISHAFPTNSSNKRPVVAPLSLVKIGGSEIYDVANVSKPCLINNEPPDFALDWKNNEDTLSEYPWPFIRFNSWGWASVQLELRVRTAIDRNDKRAKESELFSYQQVLPEEQNWLGKIDLSRIKEAEQQKVYEQLRGLIEHGVIGLSKTKTPASITIDTQQTIMPSYESDLNLNQQDQWHVTLQTDTLLGSPEALNETSDANDLFNMYKKAWENPLLANGTLELVRYFARQKLSGGEFRKKTQQKGSNYRPWYLTEAGSIFVLKAVQGKKEEARKHIELWEQQGLPLSSSSIKYYGLPDDETKHWRYCPFIPQNGYGEVAINIQASDIFQFNDNSDEVILISEVTEEENT